MTSPKLVYKKIDSLFLLALFALPINIYIIGDFLGAGVQFALVRFQISYQGNSILYVTNDLNYVLLGIYQNLSALSVIFWIIGVLLLVFAIVLLHISKINISIIRKRVGLLILTTTILFLASLISQYGPIFHGPAGTAIPIGLPVLFVIGGWMYMEGQKEEAGDEEEEEQVIDEESPVRFYDPTPSTI